MIAFVTTSGATFKEARSKAVDAFDAFFGHGAWRFSDWSATPSVHLMGGEIPELWECGWDATNVDVRRPVEK